AQNARWYGVVAGAPFLAFVPALFYGRGLHGPLARGIIFGFAVLFGATLVPLYPVAAADIFHYVADARTLVVFHQNPLTVAPVAHRFFIGISWMEQPSPYGPFWQVLTIIPTLLVGNSAVGSVIAFKLLAFAFYLLSVLAVFLIVRRTCPGRELFATLAFAWNPFITFRAVGNGHNDIVMMGLALLALYCVIVRRWRFVLPLLMLASCTKYATLLMIPPVVLYGWLTYSGRFRRDMALGGIAAALLAVVIFIPFWAGADTFKTFVGENNKAISSPPQLFSIVLAKIGVVTASSATDHLLRELGTVAFGLVYIALLAYLYRRPTFTVLFAVMALMFVADLLLQKWWFRPWYLLWFLPLVALLPTTYWTGLAVATSIGATFFDLVEQYRIYWPWVWQSDLRAYAAPVVVTFLPLLAFLVFGTYTLAVRRRSPADRRLSLRPLAGAD
ncbi:MAG: glycosyltransferase 87 family protein, partial [Dehalococcoidia bacterium]